MAFLTLGVLLSGVMTVVFKASATNGWNGSKIIMVNYLTAVAIALFTLIQNKQLQLFNHALHGMNIGTLFTQKTRANSIALVLLLGCIQGFMFVEELIARQISTVQNGSVLTVFFSKAAFVGNILISALLWKEQPSALQWAGIALIIVALILTTGNLKTLSAHRPLLFVLLMIGGVIVESINKSVVVYIRPEHNALFIGIVFLVALLLCTALNAWIAQKRGETFLPNKQEILFGVLLGVVNMLAMWANLKSLDALPTSIVFPTQAAGNLLLAFILGRVLFREPINKKLMVALGIAVVSLIIINI